MSPGFGAAECRFCRFGVGFGPPLMAPRPASYAALQLSTSPVIRGRPVIVGNADSAATMAGCAMPCVEKMRVAKGLALGLTVLWPYGVERRTGVCMKRCAGAHASTARRDASLRGDCSVRIRCEGRSARQQQRCFGCQPQRGWQLDDARLRRRKQPAGRILQRRRPLPDRAVQRGRRPLQ